jgi:hypothetical protein
MLAKSERASIDRCRRGCGILRPKREGKGHRRLLTRKETVVAIRGSHVFFGEGCLAGQPRRMAAVGTMAGHQKAAIVRLIRDEPGFSEMFIAPHGTHDPRRRGPGRSAIQFD